MTEDSYEERLRAMEQRAAGWISVEERLPEENQQIVAWFPRHGYMMIRGLKLPWWMGTDRPTHWMPLPAPPQEAKCDL